jgi:hypothetical protein
MQAQAGPSGVEADTQSALHGAQEAEKNMHSLSEPGAAVASALQRAQKDLSVLDNFQDTYLKPLKIFEAIIGEIANVCRPSSRSELN